jgi:hypothetical protein
MRLKFDLLIFCSSDQSTALHWAAFHGHWAACQLLISALALQNERLRPIALPCMIAFTTS